MDPTSSPVHGHPPSTAIPPGLSDPPTDTAPQLVRSSPESAHTDPKSLS